MIRFAILSRILLIFLSALLAFGVATLLLLRWQNTHHTRPAPFLRVEQFAADIDLLAASPASLWPAELRALRHQPIRLWIEDQPPPLDGLIHAPRLEARLRSYAQTSAAAAARVYTSDDQSNRSPGDRVEGFMALATFPLADGRTLVATPVITPEGGAMLLGLPVALWIGICGAVVAALASYGATRELRPLRALTRSLDDFNGIEPTAVTPLGGAPDVRALAAAMGTMQLRVAALMRERTFMVGAVSHDLRTFLTRLQLRVLALTDEEAKPRFASDLDSMGGLIEGALAYARGTDVGFVHQRLDLADIAATEVAEREAVGSVLPIEAVFADAFVLGDRAALRRVVANLLDNAARFGRSRVRLTARPDGARAQLIVEDDGPGIPLADRQSVLMPFHRVEGSRSYGTGVGLGLAIASRIVEAHQGTIAVGASEWGGALVLVSLPSAGAKGRPAPLSINHTG